MPVPVATPIPFEQSDAMVSNKRYQDRRKLKIQVRGGLGIYKRHELLQLAFDYGIDARDMKVVEVREALYALEAEAPRLWYTHAETEVRLTKEKCTWSMICPECNLDIDKDTRTDVYPTSEGWRCISCALRWAQQLAWDNPSPRGDFAKAVESKMAANLPVAESISDPMRKVAKLHPTSGVIQDFPSRTTEQNQELIMKRALEIVAKRELIKEEMKIAEARLQEIEAMEAATPKTRRSKKVKDLESEASVRKRKTLVRKRTTRLEDVPEPDGLSVFSDEEESLLGTAWTEVGNPKEKEQLQEQLKKLQARLRRFSDASPGKRCGILESPVVRARIGCTYRLRRPPS